MAALFDAITTTLDRARKSEHGRHAELLVNDGPLRQTIIALLQGMRLSEHNSPPAASIQMIRGRVKVTGQETVTLETGTIEELTHHRHSVEALDDSVFLLTTVTNVPGAESHDSPSTHTNELQRVHEDD
ncbi:hypothetical protein CFK39_08000 [Brachybacterium avium]|uniref:Cupin n=1 Tax=Brachybacterium avium TaxID=2017485 RepID=A0A220UCB2_9MICO|nr:hypothetical protein [Brachybacterium avium]ASK65789.1 hypothetical protein CFK39_08000 [Brachybacterium avium]